MNLNDYQALAELFQVLSHPVRLQILDAIKVQECCVCHLQALTKRPQAYVSQQLRVLRDFGLVSDEKDGQNVYYRLCDDMVAELLEMALKSYIPKAVLSDCTCPRCNEVGK